MLVKVAGKDTQSVVAALSRHVRKLPAELRKSLTWDRGSEMSRHGNFTLATNVDVYFVAQEPTTGVCVVPVDEGGRRWHGSRRRCVGTWSIRPRTNATHRKSGSTSSNRRNCANRSDRARSPAGWPFTGSDAASPVPRRGASPPPAHGELLA